MNNKKTFCVYFLLSVYVYFCMCYYFYTTRHKYHENLKKMRGTKYVLFYNGTKNDELSQGFCTANNCIFTTNIKLFEEKQIIFDAVVFKESILTSRFIPKNRSSAQIYIFHTLKSTFTYPACESYSDNFFNWTYTYRLDSDVIASYFVVRNRSGQVIAPSKSVKWPVSYADVAVAPKIKKILTSKTKAVAWVTNVCKPNSKKARLYSSLQKYLSEYSLKVDLYGPCVGRQCDNNECDAMIMRDYYFYIAFEEIFVEDFVSEEVMVAYNNYAIPIVFGAANYKWFLPPDSYLNSVLLNPFEVAWAIQLTMSSFYIHQKYFAWTNQYSITLNSPRNLLCNLCEALNKPKAKHAPVIKKFREWWNTPVGMTWCNTIYNNKTLMLDDRLRQNRHFTKLFFTQKPETHNNTKLITNTVTDRLLSDVLTESMIITTTPRNATRTLLTIWDDVTTAVQ